MQTRIARRASGAIAAAIIGGLILVGCSTTSTPSGAPSPSGSADTAVDAAGFAGNLAGACQLGQKEGVVNLWANFDADLFAKESAPFQQMYPNIKIVQGAYNPQQVAQKLEADKQTGAPVDADLVQGQLAAFQSLTSDGLLQKVDWTKYGISKDVVNTDAVNAVRIYRVGSGIGYNTDLVKASDLPNTWDKLINSKWAGQITFDTRGNYLQFLAVPWGTTKAQTWWDNFLKTDKPVAVSGSTAALQQVASGQNLLTTSATMNNVQTLQAQGAPIAMKYLDIVGPYDFYAFVPTGAQHPNAATCFLQWWASPDAVALRTKYENEPNANKVDGIGNAKMAIVSGDKAISDAGTFATYISNHSK